MKTLISTFFTIALFFSVVAIAAVNFGNNANLINLSPIATVTASGDSSAVDMLDYDGQCAAIMDVSAPVSGTNPSLALKLKSATTSGGSYTDISGAAFTTVSSTALAEKIVFSKNAASRYIKLERTVSGTASPSYLMSAKILCEKKYK